jgi:superoxide reductase
MRRGGFMKGFVCGVCGYVAIDGAAPDNCPVCWAPKDKFTEKADALKTSKDVATIGESEKKHIPSIAVSKKCGLIPAGCVDVSVKVGEIIHPMITEHFIRHIDFYIDNKYVARVMLTPEKLNPAGTIHIKGAGSKIQAVELCSVHGAWFNEVNI